MIKKTKIVATIGPKSEQPEVLTALSKAGVNIFRLNFSHGTHEEHGKKIDIIQSLKLPGAIMLDTKGPEIRTGEIKDKLFVKTGDEFTVTIEKGIYEDTGKISVNYAAFLQDIDVDDKVVFDGGAMIAKVISKTKTDAVLKAIEGQVNITTKRHINLLGKPVSLPTLTEQDWDDINFGLEKNIDMISVSFVKTANDVKELKNYCISKGHKDVKIISKIENFEATQNLEEIVMESDGIMVARGDLACEVPFSKVPTIQKAIIELCSYYQKPVIVATQMVLSMVENIRPTRAEVSDVANAIFEQADAIMTSEETTKGIDPVNVINVMSQIAIDTEDTIYNCNCDDDCECATFDNCGCDCNNEIISILPQYTDNLDAIMVITNNAEYVNSISSTRLSAPIFAFTNNKTLNNTLHLVWNTTPVLLDLTDDWSKNITLVEKYIKTSLNDKISKYLLVFEMNGHLTVQIKNK